LIFFFGCLFETAKQAIQKEQEEQAKTSNEIKQRQAENEAAIKEKIETEKSLKKLQIYVYII
jgi:hypothetical protein